MALATGLHIAGKYRLVEQLGNGAFGEVWRVTDEFRGRTAAIKFLKERVAADGVVLEKFQSEARIGERLNHPGIVKVYDFGEYDGQWYLVMEYLDGHDLATELHSHPNGLPLGRAVAFAGQIADALSEAHAHGVVHRDLKPANVMLMPGDRIKILDFGIAKFTSTFSAETFRGIVGTPAYLAPEQCRAEPVGHPADLYSLGCVLYEMVTGDRPFSTDSLQAMVAQHLHATPRNPGTGHPGFDRLIMGLLAKEPGERPASADVVASQLQSIYHDVAAAPARSTFPSPPPTAAPRPSPPPIAAPRSNPSSRRRKLIAPAAGVFALILIGAGYLIIRPNSGSGTEPDAPGSASRGKKQHFESVFQYDRGDIISADGVVLAKSDPVDNTANPLYQRVYTKDGEVFAPAIGYLAGNLQQSGIELAFTPQLNGEGLPSGGNASTTIDAQAQRVAYQQIQKTAPRGAAVVLDIATGAIKVAANYPSFDPNTITDIKRPEDVNAVFASLNSDRRQPLISKAYSELMAPGAVFEIVVAAAYLENGGNENSAVPAPYSITVPGSRAVRNSTRGVCAQETSPLIETFAASCDTTYALLGSDNTLLGPQKVAQQARKFGFYSPIPIENDLRAPASEYPNDGDAERSAFGHGETKASPLQMALISAAVANDSTLMKPYLVEKITSPDGSEIYKAAVKPMGTPISSNTAGQLRNMMNAVVTRGTAASLNSQDIAGKTGFVELTSALGTHWFVGFAPASQPKYAFAVWIETNRGGRDIGQAAPLAASILQALNRG